jgi:hypothetical protein
MILDSSIIVGELGDILINRSIFNQFNFKHYEAAGNYYRLLNVPLVTSAFQLSKIAFIRGVNTEDAILSVDLNGRFILITSKNHEVIELPVVEKSTDDEVEYERVEEVYYSSGIIFRDSHSTIRFGLVDVRRGCVYVDGPKIENVKEATEWYDSCLLITDKSNQLIWAAKTDLRRNKTNEDYILDRFDVKVKKLFSGCFIDENDKLVLIEQIGGQLEFNVRFEIDYEVDSAILFQPSYQDSRIAEGYLGVLNLLTLSEGVLRYTHVLDDENEEGHEITEYIIENSQTKYTRLILDEDRFVAYIEDYEGNLYAMNGNKYHNSPKLNHYRLPVVLYGATLPVLDTKSHRNI